MTIKTTYLMGFKVPDDWEALQRFEESVDLKEWKKIETTGFIYYKQENNCVIEESKWE